MDILKFAINMELEGEKFYTEQAEANRDNKLYGVFSALAADERHHALILQKKIEGKSAELNAGNLIKVKNVFSNSNLFNIETKQHASQLDSYRQALIKEKESIDLYKMLLSETSDTGDTEFFNYLIEQEKEHHAAIEDLILLLERTESWVESAEFGVREDY